MDGAGLARGGTEARVVTRFSLTGRLLCACLVVSAVFTAAMVNFSARHGRLLARPTYDDVGYFCDALHRIHVLDARGLRGFAADFAAAPPHSPWSTLQAMAAYLVFGLHDWAPYAANGIVVLALLLFVDFLMAGATRTGRACAALLALSVPLAGVSVTEFRPDCAAGLATAGALVLLLGRPAADGSAVRRRWAAGLLFAAALWIKPSVSPLTVALACWGWILAAAVGRFGYARPALAGLRWRAWAPLVVPVLVVAVPFYWLARAHIWFYVSEALWGSYHETYRVRGAWAVQAGYYLIGGGGSLMLGWHLVLLAAPPAAAVAVAVARGDRRGLVHWAAVGAALALAYLLPTVNQPKNPFVGVAFQALLLLAGVAALRELASRGPRPRAAAAAGGGNLRAAGAWLGHEAIGLVIAALAVGLAHWPHNVQDVAGAPDDERVLAIRRLQERAYACVAGSERRRGATVYSTVPCSGDALTVAYLGSLEGNEIAAECDVSQTDLATHRRLMQGADFVIAGEPGNGLVYPWLELEQFQQQTLELVRSMPAFELMATIPAMNGKHFYVFGRRPQIAAPDLAGAAVPGAADAKLVLRDRR